MEDRRVILSNLFLNLVKFSCELGNIEPRRTLGDNTGVYRIVGLFLNIKSLSFRRYITRPVVMRPSSHTH